MKQKPLNRLISLIVCLELASLVAFSGVACFLAERTFRNKSEVLLVTLRNEFIRGDLRSVNKQLQTAVSQHQFLALGFKDGPFMERVRTAMELPFLDAEATFPVLADGDDNRSQISEFRVRYSLVEPLLNASILWGVFTILLLSFVPILRRNLQRQILLEQEQLRREREYQTARQVAHDIRSPITALKMAAERIAGADQEKELITMACDRMTKIAEDLLEKSRPSARTEVVAPPMPVAQKGFAPVAAIKEIVVEIQMQAKRPIGLNIEGLPEDLFLSLEKSEFQRALVNLINNSLEATAEVEESEIQVYLRYQNQAVSISISDNGAGIPEEILGNLGQRGMTHGKANGNGLGLYHAKTLFEGAGGRLVIQSKHGVGTLVTIQIPVPH